jgi:cardiolipin synthase
VATIIKRIVCRSILDPAADKLLLVSSFITLYTIDLLPLWLLALIFLRDVMIVSGAVDSFIDNGQSKIKNNSKAQEN